MACEVECRLVAILFQVSDAERLESCRHDLPRLTERLDGLNLSLRPKRRTEQQRLRLRLWKWSL